MSDNILYHLVQPSNQKSPGATGASGGYREAENVDFDLAFEGRKLVAGSLRLEGDVQVFSADGATRIEPGIDIKIDERVGAHAFCSGWVTSFQNVGAVENLQSYPRLVAMKTCGQMSKNDMNNSDMVCEMRTPAPELAKRSILKRVPKAYGGGGAGLVAGASAATQLKAGMETDPDFSIKPLIGLNTLVGPNQVISYGQTGMIKVTVTLEKNMGALYGGAVTTANIYVLQNLRMTFRSVPDDGQMVPIVMRTSLAIKNSMTSAVNNVSSKVPAVCDSISLSYLPQEHEFSPNYNNLALEEPPAFSKITYSFNDALNRFVTYQIDSKAEMGRRALDSLDFDGSTTMTLERMSSNDGFLQGLSWESLVDLSNQKFNINSETGVSSSRPYIQFSYFHSLRKF